MNNENSLEMPSDFIKQFGVPVEIRNLDPKIMIQGATPFNIHFQNQAGERVGLITVENDQLVFTGNADEAARLFFEHVLKPMVDAYIAQYRATLPSLVKDDPLKYHAEADEHQCAYCEKLAFEPNPSAQNHYDDCPVLAARRLLGLSEGE